MANSVENPQEVVGPVEDRRLLAYVVQLRQELLNRFSVSHRVQVLVPNCSSSERQTGEEEVVEGNEVVVVDGLAGVAVDVRKHELRQREHQVLVEEVQD